MNNDLKKIIFISGAYFIENSYTGKYKLEVDCNELVGKYIFNSTYYNNKIKWKIKKKHFSEFINKLSELNVFSWKNDYSDSCVCDGGYWSLKFEYLKNEPIEIKGDNAYPNNFEEFYLILEKYFPIIKMDNKYRWNIQKKYS